MVALSRVGMSLVNNHARAPEGDGPFQSLEAFQETTSHLCDYLRPEMLRLSLTNRSFKFGNATLKLAAL